MTSEQGVKKRYPGAFSHGIYPCRILVRRKNGTCKVLGKGPAQDSRRAWADALRRIKAKRADESSRVKASELIKRYESQPHTGWRSEKEQEDGTDI